MLCIHLLGYLRLFDELPLQFHARPRALDLGVSLLLNRVRPMPRGPRACLPWPGVPATTAQTIDLEQPYLVFLIPQRGYCTLYVAERTPTSFTVRAQEGKSCGICP